MGTKGTTLDDFVAIALVKLVCLVLKLSWMENAEQTKEIMQRLGQFLQVRLHRSTSSVIIFEDKISFPLLTHA
jgi:hypothetical protein